MKKKKKEEFISDFKTTEEIEVPEKILDQVIGQDKAVNIVRKAALQRRNVFLIGLPGTGKSMIAKGMAELMPVEDLEDVICVANPVDENNPKIMVMKTYSKETLERIKAGTAKPEELVGNGRKYIIQRKLAKMSKGSSKDILLFLFLILVIGLVLLQIGGNLKISFESIEKYSTIIAAIVLGFLIIISTYLFTSKLKFREEEEIEAKLIVDNSGKTTAPFVEATGAKAGALLGDCRHDPYQSGGLGTPAHLRVEAGAIHRANKGVLYIDEIASLSPKSQQDLLTAMQEKKFPITGQSEMSSGAIVRTEPVPCDFVLVAAGNIHDLQNIHPALRSRIKGYGYEVFLNDTMPNTKENRDKIARFVAQEVKKDGKIPHFTKEAVIEIINEAIRRSGRKNRISLKLRDLGGLVRAAGDIARQKGKKYTDLDDVIEAKKFAKSIEQQIAEELINVKKEYSVLITEGSKVGRVNGLAVIGDSGLVIPIVAEAARSSSKFEGKIIATGKLGEIAKEAVENVSAIIKKYKDVKSYDIHIQFLQTYEGIEGDSASISVAVAVISALEKIPVKQNIAMTGSLSVRGEVLPVGGIVQKIDAAIASGIKEVIIPEKNYEDVSDDQKKKIKIIKVRDIIDVIKYVLVDCKEKKELIERLKRE
ncbi:MAG: ATP-dependent protease LonB [Candidatus Micrarchaeia archaeon]